MATWTQKPPTGTTTRRKWNLEDRTSLNNLKYHIAADGCSEVQYDLAKELLNTNGNGSTSNPQSAVHWLLCASQQGHEDATKLLRQCYDNRSGITPENEEEVRYCLSMTSGERAARKAARELFSCLSNGNEHITPKQLERKMREIYKMQKKRQRRGYPKSTSEEEEESEEEKNNTNNGFPQPGQITNNRYQYQNRTNSRRNAVEIQSGRFITEDNLVAAAEYYATGRMPTVNDELSLSIPHPSTLDHVPLFHRLLFHPIIFFTLLYHQLINFVTALPGSVPVIVRGLMLLVAYWFTFSGNLNLLLPLGFYYFCLIVMMWSTCKMLKTKHDYIDFRIWSGLFLSYGDHNIEADISETRFLKNNMKPYLYFFAAFISNLIVYPLIEIEWLPHSELTIISGIFVFVSLVIFMYSSPTEIPDWAVLVSFGVNVLAKYPYEMDEVVTTGWRFLDLKVPTFCSFVIGNGIEFCLNCRAALYLIIPIILVHLAKRSNWHGTYTHLIPHCVTLSWLQLCITTSLSATMFGVVRATLGVAGILLFLPLFGIVSILIPVFLAIEFMGFTDPGWRMGSTIIVGILALLGSCLLAINRNTQKYITVLQVVLCVIAACGLTFPYMTSNFKETSRFNSFMLSDKPTRMPEEIEYLSWQRFYELCGQPAWDHQNKIVAQMRCAYLNDAKVSWEGTVDQVQIIRVHNKLAEYVNKYMPHWTIGLINCLLGEPISQSAKCRDPKVLICNDFYRTLKVNQLDGKCTLNKWNLYEYEIRVKMTSGLLSKDGDVVLHANDDFTNFTSRIASGDRIHFFGTLYNTRFLSNGDREDLVLGSSFAYIELLATECTACKRKDISPVFLKTITKSPVNARILDLMRGIKYLLNVLFNPLITFK